MAAHLQSFRPVSGKQSEDQNPVLTHPVAAGAPATPGLGLFLKLKAGLEDRLWLGKLLSSMSGKMTMLQSLHRQEGRANDVSRLLLPLKKNL